MSGSLPGRDAVLITGASSALGADLIGRLSAHPDPPLILAHYNRGAEAFEKAAHIMPLQTDFRDAAAVAAMAERIVSQVGAPRRMVHFPAMPLRYERVTKLNWDRIAEDMNVQVRSVTELLRRFLPAIAKRESAKKAKVVFVLSSVTTGARPAYMAEYSIVKFALLGLMRTLASEYPAIGVNAVSPAMIETPFLSGIPHTAVEMNAKNHPLGRNARPEDVTQLIEFLLSDASDYMTGLNIPVTGRAGEMR